MNLADVRAVITGGASGLGFAVAEHLSAHGGRVTLFDIQDAQGRQAAGSLGAAAGYQHCDVSSETSIDAAMQAAAAAMGGLNVVVNCAGIGSAGRILGRSGPIPMEQFTRTIQINLVGTFMCDRAAAVIMQHNTPGPDGERGVLIHTSSVAAFEGQIGQAAYTATKAAVAAMTLPIARELAMFGIRCVAIAPGIFQTPMLGNLPPEVQESLGRQIPFPSRLGKPSEFAALAAAIITNPMLNGTTIRLDGAIRMQPK
ncbi:MAG TPA: SDR family NAD(P)-dependent oxidoreductase [Steroidobacteraceae bacterium]|nr:SDR family NAD(P)-dependent oxidoreductase [Steroidobacteraceae bacterium]